MSTLIEFYCREAAHQRGSGQFEAVPNSASPVTICDGRWAYCPAGAENGHAWEAIRGIELSQLRWQFEHRSQNSHILSEASVPAAPSPPPASGSVEGRPTGSGRTRRK